MFEEPFAIEGESTVETARFLTFDGNTWSTRELDSRPYSGGMWALSTDDIYVGGGYELVRFKGGSSLTIQPTVTLEGEDWIGPIWGHENGDIFALAGEWILKFDGVSMQPVGPRGRYFDLIGDSKKVVARGGTTTAIYENGYWRDVASMRASYVKLVAGLDDRIYAMIRSGNSGMFIIEQLP
jgi:hypothetical protein